MRKALIVGINYYEHASALFGCVDDAHAVKSILATHADGSVNFDAVLLTGTGPGDVVSRTDLKDGVKALFADDSDIALFYFAGHGHVETTGGYLLTTESKTGDAGLPLSEIMTLANRSKARNKMIILDSCHSGMAGSHSIQTHVAEIAEGVTVLTASTAEQYATEENGHGIFTSLFVDAMTGPAANLIGDVTPGGVYAHIDQSLGPWDQRPVFKTNVKSFISLRKVQAPIALADLQRITEFFPKPGYQFQLDPSFEPELKGKDPGMPPPNLENCRKFAVLQKYNRVNLVVPVDAPHMWHAAMGSKSCRLTVLGEHYRRLRARGRL